MIHLLYSIIIIILKRTTCDGVHSSHCILTVVVKMPRHNFPWKCFFKTTPNIGMLHMLLVFYLTNMKLLLPALIYVYILYTGYTYFEKNIIRIFRSLISNNDKCMKNRFSIYYNYDIATLLMIFDLNSM